MATIEILFQEISGFALFGQVKNKLLAIEKNVTVI